QQDRGRGGGPRARARGDRGRRPRLGAGPAAGAGGRAAVRSCAGGRRHGRLPPGAGRSEQGAEHHGLTLAARPHRRGGPHAAGPSAVPGHRAPHRQRRLGRGRGGRHGRGEAGPHLDPDCQRAVQLRRWLKGLVDQVGRARAAFAAGDPGGAEAVLTSLLQDSRPRPKGRFAARCLAERGRARLERGDAQGCVADCQQARAADGRLPAAFVVEARGLQLQERWDDSRKERPHEGRPAY
ncbi:unnamed protein product, partial [Prorocentrum cordatum]